ncbi:ATP-dependent DNA helicase RecQ [Mycena indigotica]|uniref:DNA 3'-5' helicase n=1 Tax=Mycena indigotica TaxID=2126181 RepID=A0A8H6S5C4_9AGAR|nr:ATP-dependent DNA helicase RecQ [Mycena indigotica]KAF7293390.1 ATP-dependent DNA helicase RecQ [Mycena indigotica]
MASTVDATSISPQQASLPTTSVFRHPNDTLSIAPQPATAPSGIPPAPQRVWTFARLRDLGQEVFGKRLCLRQMQPALALQSGKDVVHLSATASGKTMTFLLRLLMACRDGEDKMVFGITPLVMIGKQMEVQLAKVGIKSVNLTAENNKPEIYQAIIRGEYQVVTASPEILDGDRFHNLWKQQKVKDRLLYIVFDEAHCITTWGKTFRPHYLRVGNLRHLLPPHVLFFVTSATIPEWMLHEIKSILRLRSGDGSAYFIHSNDCPNIRLLVRPMQYAVASYKDLAFLIPPGFKSLDSPPPKFLVFFDSIPACEDAIEYLRSRLPSTLRAKLRYFHATMTSEYRADTFEAFKSGQIWGLAVTDAFGMGLDLPDVEIVVQYRLTRGGDACTLWQRIGRAARDPAIEGTAVVLVDESTYDHHRIATVARSQKKRKTPDTPSAVVGAKRRKRADGLPVVPLALVYAGGESTVPWSGAFLGIDPSPSARKARYLLPPDLETSSNPQKKNDKSTLQLGSALDDMVNAAERGLLCHREPFYLYFSYKQMQPPSHIKCDETIIGGCQRCKPTIPRICCALCHPTAFDHIAPITLPRLVKPAKTSVKKAYELSATGKHILGCLEVWRESTAERTLDSCVLDMYGVSALMSDNILLRLAICADLKKLPDAAAIQRETSWQSQLVEEYGNDILSIVHSVQPIPERMSTISTPKAVRLCGNCRQPGHNRM